MTYVILPTTRIIYPGQGSVIQPGLKAAFKGRQRLWDSELAQKRNRWTDEQRRIVEDHLLSHKDYGKGLYLAPGETLPEDRVSTVDDDAQAPVRKCSFIKVVNGELDQCPTEAWIGSEFCQEHDPESIKIEKGMLTA